ncbi:protein yippee-like 1 [Notothenia coriiceps]|uniref:Protein yippee-like n=1 Tax=Notothenia coriiceps TaxID=8208 RepID=A0A6I9NQE9_9TELE|nr:PREDICTED: protein yippee-like 1 [Notothenia coriiceps]
MPRFIPHLQQNVCVWDCDKVDNKYAQQILGEKHPRAAVAQILVPCIVCSYYVSLSFSLQSFQGSQGRAYLFNSVVNVGCGPAEERVLLTGLHAVADIYCENCKTTLGWKYEHAFESSQKYKEGKFIIELAHMIKDNGWE